jgi:hypothetical protein
MVGDNRSMPARGVRDRWQTGRGLLFGCFVALAAFLALINWRFGVLILVGLVLRVALGNHRAMERFPSTSSSTRVLREVPAALRGRTGGTLAIGSVAVAVGTAALALTVVWQDRLIELPSVPQRLTLSLWAGSPADIVAEVPYTGTLRYESGQFMRNDRVEFPRYIVRSITPPHVGIEPVLEKLERAGWDVVETSRGLRLERRKSIAVPLSNWPLRSKVELAVPRFEFLLTGKRLFVSPDASSVVTVAGPARILETAFPPITRVDRLPDDKERWLIRLDIENTDEDVALELNNRFARNPLVERLLGLDLTSPFAWLLACFVAVLQDSTKQRISMVVRRLRGKPRRHPERPPRRRQPARRGRKRTAER